MFAGDLAQGFVTHFVLLLVGGEVRNRLRSRVGGQCAGFVGGIGYASGRDFVVGDDIAVTEGTVVFCDDHGAFLLARFFTIVLL